MTVIYAINIRYPISMEPIGNDRANNVNLLIYLAVIVGTNLYSK